MTAMNRCSSGFSDAEYGSWRRCHELILYKVGWWDDWRIKYWKGYRRKRSWPNLRCYYLPEGTEENDKKSVRIAGFRAQIWTPYFTIRSRSDNRSATTCTKTPAVAADSRPPRSPNLRRLPSASTRPKYNIFYQNKILMPITEEKRKKVNLNKWWNERKTIVRWWLKVYPECFCNLNC
jgi:hypothetical protein